MIKILLLSTLVGCVCHYYYKSCKFPVKAPHELYDIYDYIVVGAGSAGSVVAARLSEDQSVSVLLLEAGSDGIQIPWSHIPGLASFNKKTSIDWQYKTVPQKLSCFGMDNQESVWPRGKVLGGSSVLNVMLHVRGSPEDYDHWARDLGCPGWSYKDVLKYFKKLEKAADEAADPNLRGKDGPINVIPSPETLYGTAYLAAAQEAGYMVMKDSNGMFSAGFSRLEHSIRHGWRSSTVAEYLLPNKYRKNLHVATHSTVTKINIKWSVSYNSLNAHGGAINTPQLLMLSGIGPRNDLEKLNVSVIVDLPQVGKNLQDHILIPIPISLNQSIGTETARPLSLESAKRFAKWAIFGTGPMSWPLLEAHGFLHSGVEPKLEAPLPDLRSYLFVSDHSSTGQPVTAADGTNNELGRKNQRETSSATLYTEILQPRSYGIIKLQSSDPLDHPIIDPKYLTRPRDVKALIKGMKINLDLLQTQAMQKLGAKLVKPLLPGCKKFLLWSDKYLDCLIRHETFTNNHPSGTCRMGRDKNTAVVGPDLRVFDVQNLRVTDASVFPNIPSGNTNIPAIMVGEKAADLIKSSNKKS